MKKIDENTGGDALCHEAGQFLELKPDEKRSKITAKDPILGVEL